MTFNFYYRLHLSDGISTLIAMITDKVDKVAVSRLFTKILPHVLTCQIPKYSIIKVRGNMAVNDVQSRK